MCNNSPWHFKKISDWYSARDERGELGIEGQSGLYSLQNNIKYKIGKIKKINQVLKQESLKWQVWLESDKSYYLWSLLVVLWVFGNDFPFLSLKQWHKIEISHRFHSVSETDNEINNDTVITPGIEVFSTECPSIKPTTESSFFKLLFVNTFTKNYFHSKYFLSLV